MDTEAVSILACNARINEGKGGRGKGVAVEKAGFTEGSYTSEGLACVNVALQRGSRVRLGPRSVIRNGDISVCYGDSP
jgi:hypothetical protein